MSGWIVKALDLLVKDRLSVVAFCTLSAKLRAIKVKFGEVQLIAEQIHVVAKKHASTSR